MVKKSTITKKSTLSKKSSSTTNQTNGSSSHKTRDIIIAISIVIIALASTAYIILDGFATSPVDNYNLFNSSNNSTTQPFVRNSSTNQTPTTPPPYTPPSSQDPTIPSPPASGGTAPSGSGASGGSGFTTNPPAQPPQDYPLVTGFTTDGGINYLSSGSCLDVFNNLSYDDACLSNTLLREYYYGTQDGVAGCWYQDHDCSTTENHVCSQGRCLQFIAYSQDEMYQGVYEGLNIYEKGSCTDILGTHEEYCSESIITEWYILNNFCKSNVYYCQHGCLNGACVEEPTSQDPYISDDVMNCDAFCQDNNYNSGNLPGQGPCEITMLYDEYSCCCNGEQTSPPPTSCSLTCTSQGFTGAKIDALTSQQCMSLQGSLYPQTAWLNDDCCCYFIPYDEDGDGVTNDYSTQSTCYYNAGLFYQDHCIDSQVLYEASLVLDTNNNPIDCYYKPLNCTRTLGQTSMCSNGACVDNPIYDSCDAYCSSMRGYSSGTCEVGRGTPEAVCSSFGETYEEDGDITCSTGNCCCS